MAGTLVIDQLKTSTGVLATQNGMTGIAKAWVNYNGSAGTVRGSYNVTSVTKSGTGQYVINFTTAMPNANYACSAISGRNYAGFSVTDAFNPLTVVAQSTTACSVQQTIAGPAFADAVYVGVSIFSA